MSDGNNNNNHPKNEILKDEEALVLDHNYDGIQELDNPLPSWWLGIFYVTIAFAVVYVGYYMIGSGPTLRQELNVSMKEIEALRPPPTAGGAEADSQKLLAVLKDPAHSAEHLKHGGEVFAAKCIACHGAQGQGVIGPNLTDDYWIHGDGTLKSLVETVSNGVPDKGMPPWGPVLTPDELIDVVGYIHSLHGTNPPEAKAPQGEKKEYKD